MPVSFGDNYQVIVDGPAGESCRERMVSGLGYFPERGVERLRVTLGGVAEVHDAGDKPRCKGMYFGYVEFRQPGITFREVPHERLGSFSFEVAGRGGDVP